MTISRIIGTESKKSDRPIGSTVKSRDEPRTASRSIDQKELSTASMDGVTTPFKDIKLTLFCKKEIEGKRVSCLQLFGDLLNSR
jgi:hypothetical protein